jgi:hypothetical protein
VSESNRTAPPAVGLVEVYHLSQRTLALPERFSGKAFFGILRLRDESVRKATAVSHSIWLQMVSSAIFTES